MAERDNLLQAVQAARNGGQLAIAVAALDAHDRRRTASLQQSRETDLSATAVRATLEPLPAFERHTAATDWLGDEEIPSDYRTAMIAEASKWYRSIPRDLAADPDEFNEQALGHAYTAASPYGVHALAARREFMTYVGYLTRSGASGLPQIQQTEDPKDNPAATPLPPDVFDNFAPEQNQLNTQVESPNHQSQISSDGAPMIQQIEQQDGSGSGFGSGPERPDEHSTSMDTSNSYAEIPLGPPGTIPTTPPGAAPSAPSTPNPALGQEMDEGAQQRRGSLTVAAYTRPDQDGFRWHIGSDQDADTFDTPYHERCGSLHWPEQSCSRGQAHTASVAVGYVMNAEDFARRAHFEAQGSAEGTAVLRAAAGNLAKLARHHDTLAGGFKLAARTEDEIAWLHGYLARVRPVLAGGKDPFGGKAAPPFGADEPEDGGGKKRKKKNKKGKPWDKTGSGLDFPLAAEAAAAGDSVPLRICPQCGSTYCKHWQGRDKPYDLPGEPYGMAKDAAMRKGAPFAGYEDFADCVAKNKGKRTPDAYCGYIKHKVEDKGGKKEGAALAARLSPPDLAAANRELAKLAHAEEEQPRHYWDTYSDLQRRENEKHDQPPPEPAAYDRQHQAASQLSQIQEITDSAGNPNPGGDQLNPEVMWPLVSGEDGEDKDRSKEAARRSMTPSNSALRMFGRMDAMEGKPPPHKDRYVFGVKGHGQYLRGHNETRGVIDAMNDRAPVGKEKYAGQTGRPDLHAHYLGVYSDTKARRDQDIIGRVPEERAFSNEPGGYLGSLRRQADILTKPHESTDDQAPPFNSAQTTPQPQSSNEASGDYGQGVKDGQEDAAAGENPTFSDNSSRVSPYVQGYSVGYSGRPPDTGTQDVPGSMGGDSGQAQNAAEAQTSFQVSQASLRRTAECIGCGHPSHLGQPCPATGCQHYHNPGEEGAGPGMHARTIGHVPDPGAPGYSMPRGGQPSRGWGEDEYEGSGDTHDDSGYESDYGRYEDGHDLDPGGRHAGSRHMAHDFTEEQREEAAHSLGPEHKLPVNSKQDLENAHIRAHQVKGIPESQVDAYLSRLDKEFGKAASLRQVSAAFITREAVREPDFRKGYRYAARWQPGMLLVQQGSPAFEAGLYAAIADRPAVQKAWAGEHYRLSGRFPVLGARLNAHSSFTVKFAEAHGGRYLISASGYLVPRRTAATSVDLITDGPGTSPDPMGATPLNGPGQPPPMGGGEDPARSGGVPPYQGAPPPASAPVAPDDVLGTPQEAPQPSGPFTQTFSGRQPGNADLAPVAPNTAGGGGYSNTEAYQGDPLHKPQAMAFRKRVQASLAASRAS